MGIAVRVRRALGKGAVADVVLALIRQDRLSLRQLHRRSSYGPDEVCEAVSALKVKLARNGVSPQYWARCLSAKCDELWAAEVADQCTEEYFAGACEANGYEFHEDGSMA